MSLVPSHAARGLQNSRQQSLAPVSPSPMPPALSLLFRIVLDGKCAWQMSTIGNRQAVVMIVVYSRMLNWRYILDVLRLLYQIPNTLLQYCYHAAGAAGAAVYITWYIYMRADDNSLLTIHSSAPFTPVLSPAPPLPVATQVTALPAFAWRGATAAATAAAACRRTPGVHCQTGAALPSPCCWFSPLVLLQTGSSCRNK